MFWKENLIRPVAGQQMATSANYEWQWKKLVGCSSGTVPLCVSHSA